MKRFSSSSKETNPSRNSNSSNFADPIRKLWVGLALLFLFFFMLPIWPVSGLILGIPTWAVLAVGFSFLLSVFIAYAILWVWRDPDNSSISSDVNNAD